MNQNFIPDLHELTGDVVRSKHQFYIDTLQRWFAHLDSDPHTSALITSLETRVDFDSWYKMCQSTASGMAGSGKITWPKDPLDRLGMQLKLFRAFAEARLSPFDFCHSFLYSANNHGTMISDINNAVFEPFSRDLVKFLVRDRESMPTSVPASDRVVLLNHNIDAYQTTIDAISKTESALKGANDISLEDKEMRLAELSAGQKLLAAAQVRISAIVPVLVGALRWLGRVFAEQAIGILAAAAISALLTLLGFAGLL